MIDCISVENMRNSDRHTIENGVPSITLIQRAAMAVYNSVSWRGTVAIVCGSGNNGADGYALACILKEQGIACSLIAVNPKLHGDAAHYAEKAEKMGITILSYQSGILHGFDIIVDCMLGTGFKGNLRDTYRNAIEEINTSSATVISVDINSGLNGDDGTYEAAVISDLTVTIGYVKTGLIVKNVEPIIKQLICVDIGIGLLKEEYKICTHTEWRQLCIAHGIDERETKLELQSQIYYLCPSWLDIQ